MNDPDDTGQALYALQLLEQEWLADEAAQAEYTSWLDVLTLTHRTNANEPQQPD